MSPTPDTIAVTSQRQINYVAATHGHRKTASHAGEPNKSMQALHQRWVLETYCTSSHRHCTQFITLCVTISLSHASLNNVLLIISFAKHNMSCYVRYLDWSAEENSASAARSTTSGFRLALTRRINANKLVHLI